MGAYKPKFTQIELFPVAALSYSFAIILPLINYVLEGLVESTDPLS
jgi:hypothetical protein